MPQNNKDTEMNSQSLMQRENKISLIGNTSKEPIHKVDEIRKEYFSHRGATGTKVVKKNLIQSDRHSQSQRSFSFMPTAFMPTDE